MRLKKLQLQRNMPADDDLSEIERNVQELKNALALCRKRRLLRILLIGFFIGRGAEQRTDKLTAQIQKRIIDNLSVIRNQVHEIELSGTYLIHSKKKAVLSQLDLVKSKMKPLEKSAVLSGFLIDMKRYLDENRRFVLSYNSEFVKQRKHDYSYLWSKGDIILDDEQQTAIVTDDKYNLVVAAAGSGKTETLITRIAYLIKRRPDGTQPDRILAIAYQRKAREQIEQRLQSRYGISEVRAKTFHKLGKDILELSGRRIEHTDIVNENKKFGFIQSYFEEKVHVNPEFYKLFVRYMKTVHDEDEKATESEKKAVVSYAMERKYAAIDGTKVNSYAEKEIMDYLLTHKVNGNPIEVKYEPDLEGFRPDFYLPKYDVFIEHWGIDIDGNVPQWFSMSSDEYRASMEKKKQWFAENKKNLVETYSYEFNPKDPEAFYETLRQRLQAVVKEPFLLESATYEEILKLVWESQKTPIDDIKNFITTAKTYDFSPEVIRKKLEGVQWSSKQRAFGNLALNVFEAYQAQLHKLGKIDFEDMINEATVAMKNSPELCKDAYDHILVDEYQDMSAQRLNLLKNLLDRNPTCRLFCVGDDWQSIMGFSGSNLNFFVKFKEYFENPEVNQICTNYRSTKSIVDAGAALIKNNGKKQIQKKALAMRKENRPILVLGSPQKGRNENQYYTLMAEDCLGRIKDYLEKGYSAEEIFVLTRFMRSRVGGRSELFKLIQIFKFHANQLGVNVSIDNARESNSVRLLTVHKCKGLEARIVFVLNVVSGEFGFPNEIEDPSILEVARGDNGIEDQVEEERRLFYVAMTRTKQDLYIYTRLGNRSRFLNEIVYYSQPVTMNCNPYVNIQVSSCKPVEIVKSNE
jgi:DNA helicase IV